MVMKAAMQALLMRLDVMVMLGVVGQLASWRFEPAKPPMRAWTSHIPEGRPFDPYDGGAGQPRDGAPGGFPDGGPGQVLEGCPGSRPEERFHSISTAPEVAP